MIEDARRTTDRVPLHADVEVLSPSRAKGVVLNASTGGLRIALDHPVYVDDVCDLKIAMGDEEGRNARARVVWVREMPDGWVVGLELVRETKER